MARLAFNWSRDPDFLAWVEALGVPIKETRRVVIDAEVGHALKVYVEMYVDRAAFAGAPPPAILDAGIVVNGSSAAAGALADRVARLEEALHHIAERADRGERLDGIARVARTALNGASAGNGHAR